MHCGYVGKEIPDGVVGDQIASKVYVVGVKILKRFNCIEKNKKRNLFFYKNNLMFVFIVKLILTKCNT